MRISLLLEREPFPEIFERALMAFLWDWTDKTHVVKWHNGRPADLRGQLWHCNQYLNAVFAQGVRKEVLEPVFREYSRSVRPWLTLLQKLYVYLATARHTSDYFARAFVEIDPPLVNAENLLILGGNHHLRLLDYRNDCCFVLKKSGFRADCFTEEVRIRLENPYLPSPVIRKVANNGSWYSEKLIFGTPINRLKDQCQVEKALQEIVPLLQRLYEKTKFEVSTEEYVQGLVKRIDQLVHVNRHLAVRDKDELRQEVRLLSRCAISPGVTDVIMTVQSHGDFQPANILLGDSQAWLIDWEYTARRQVAFDGLVYLLYSRSPAGLSQRIADFVRCKHITSTSLLETRLHDVTVDVGRERIALFLLEELELKLAEVSNPSFRTLGVGFTLFRAEMERSITVLGEGGL